MERFRDRRDRYVLTEGRQGFRSTLFTTALELVRHADEAQKPDQTRLKEYTDANFPILRQSITSAAPIYPELEKLTLTFSLSKLRETLGPDDAFTHKVLAGKSPAERGLRTGRQIGPDRRRAAPAADRRRSGDDRSVHRSDDPVRPSGR